MGSYRFLFVRLRAALAPGGSFVVTVLGIFFSATHVCCSTSLSFFGLHLRRSTRFWLFPFPAEQSWPFSEVPLKRVCEKKANSSSVLLCHHVVCDQDDMEGSRRRAAMELLKTAGYFAAWSPRRTPKPRFFIPVPLAELKEKRGKRTL